MCDCDYLEEEVEELKAEVKQKSEQINSWRRLWVIKRNTDRELWATLHNTKAELTEVRHDLADTTKTLDKYRDMHVKRSRANSDLRKSVADLEDTIHTLTEERDLARELFQGMVTKHAKLLDRYSMIRDHYDDLVSRYDALLPHNEAEHGEF